MAKLASRDPTIGAFAEQQALCFLLKQGLQWRASNYHCAAGEIDLIMQDNDYLVFVEVRYRAKASHGTALESVTVRKQQKLITSAQYYLQQYQHAANSACRFDVVAVTHHNNQLQIDWQKNAFSC